MSNSSESHQEDHTEGNVEAHGTLIKTPKQLIVTIVLSFIIPVVVIILLVSWVTSGTKTSAGSDTLGAEATALRIAPVAKIEITEGGAPVAPMVVAATPVVVAVAAVQSEPVSDGPADMVKGEQIYKQACMACHAVGVAGAPKFGDKTAWGPAMSRGMDSMVANAIKGKGVMPARGGLAAASDKDISDAVHYMVGQLK
ncbi:MAG: c-type cytochrome [Orrella sp.]|jgi:cytochrome c5|uniref:c-type cytochrome n=1 Tax=Orrella sp. TaxID=1921583 RepID=UPI003BDCFC4A